MIAAVDGRKSEAIVPWFPYALGAMAQAVAPRLTARVQTYLDYPDDTPG
jgi:hypothetical protein